MQRLEVLATTLGTANTPQTYHEGVVERRKDVGNSEVLIAIGDLVLQGGDLLYGLLFLSRSLGLLDTNNRLTLSPTVTFLLRLTLLPYLK
jgi:hypothetical protein